MRDRRIARITVLALSTALAALAAPAAAQPADEIEMDPEPAPAKPAPPAPPAPTPATPAPTDAAPPVKDPKLAKKWLTTGQQLLQKGDSHTRAKRTEEAQTSYQNAVTAFEKSIETGDDLNTYALLAEAEDKLGKHDVAVRHYRMVVKAQAGVRADVQKKASAKLDELAAKVALVTVKVKPDGAAVMLNGTEIGKTPLADALVLLPGTYTLSFQAEGFQPREAELNVEAGSESEREIELEAVKIVVVPPVKDEDPVPVPPAPPPSRLPLYVGGGAAVALLGAATVTGLLAVGRHNTYESSESTPAERKDARSSGKSLALVTDIALAGGLVATGFTAYWYFAKYRPAQRKQTEQRPAATSAGRGRRDGSQWTKIDLVPWVQSGTSGLVLVGGF
ncbi:MAG TPA: PEGA domain-containing protein [Kofleriaceae bacterium]|nr:PEGA domain-containing protein [Kofleriaceae bacterium]